MERLRTPAQLQLRDDAKQLTQTFEHMPKLVSLPRISLTSISDALTLTACMLPRLHELVLSQDSEVPAELVTTFAAAVRNMTELRVLYLGIPSTGCLQLTDDLFRDCMLHKPHLWWVCMTLLPGSSIGDAALHQVADKCPSLKTLKLFWAKTDTGQLRVSVPTINAFFASRAFRGLHLTGPQDTVLSGPNVPAAITGWREDPRRCILLQRATDSLVRLPEMANTLHPRFPSYHVMFWDRERV